MKPLLATFLVLTGCSLYGGNNNTSGDDVCEGPATGVSESLLDPSDGVCTTIAWGGGGDCGVATPIAEPATPDWASCDSACEQLGESACLTTSGCRAAYVDPSGIYGSGTGQQPNTQAIQFWQCWGTAPQGGPIEGGGCSALDAQSCSDHDDCIAIYSESQTLGNDAGTAATTFERCAPEPTNSTCGSGFPACGAGYTCEDNCADGSGSGSGSSGSGSASPVYNGVDIPVCAPQCVPTLDPGTCMGTVTCNSAPPTCPSDTVAGILDGCYSGYCIPQSACGGDPGNCGPLGGGSGSAVCAIAVPACPSGSTPGVLNGCYTGYCIPDSQCPQLACGDLMSETACDARSDCESVYLGQDCTCEGGECSCASETYEYCDTVDSGSGGYVNPGGPAL